MHRKNVTFGACNELYYYAMNKPSLLITDAEVTEAELAWSQDGMYSKAQRCYIQQLAHSSWFRVAKLL